MTRIATGFTDPVGFARTGEAAQLIVGEREGTAWLIDGKTGARTAVTDIATVAGTELLDIAFGPANAFYKGPILLRKTADSIYLFRPNVGSFIDAGLATGNTTDVTASVYFAANGRLFAAVGDPRGTIAQSDDSFSPGGFGKFFVEGNPYAYASLRSIPLIQAGKGLQAPTALDNFSDQLILFDGGSTKEHEISVFTPTQPSLNFGWPFYEGTVEFQNGAPGGLVTPSLVYPHGDGPREGLGPVGGIVYQGAIPGIAGHFVFADRDGTIWSIPSEKLTDAKLHRVAELERRTADFTPDIGAIDQIVEMTADAQGTLYILDADGEVFRVDPA
ncbi:hypothetical protein [Aurantiacibacter flavus]|uniref:hypothetical protein n=1 Tax=Aurantiacibacter flavus TaxID=3145232 RepID=UPI00321640B0